MNKYSVFFFYFRNTPIAGKKFRFFVTPLCKMRPAGRKTRVVTETNGSCVSEGNYCHIFGSWFSDVNGLQTVGSERPDVEVLQKNQCPAACASQWSQPSLSAMTHMLWLRGQSGHAGTEDTRSVVFPLVSVAASLAHRLVLVTRTRANVNVRLRPLVQRTGKERKKAKGKKDRKKGRERRREEKRGEEKRREEKR